MNNCQNERDAPGTYEKLLVVLNCCAVLYSSLNETENIHRETCEWHNVYSKIWPHLTSANESVTLTNTGGSVLPDALQKNTHHTSNIALRHTIT